MPPDNVEQLRAVYARWAQGDLRAGIELFDPDVVSVWPEGFPTRGTYLGLEAHSRAMREWLSAWDEFELEAEDFLSADGTVVVPFLVRARGRGSGVRVERRWAHAWTMRGGRAVRFEVFLSVRKACAAAGLHRPPA